MNSAFGAHSLAKLGGDYSSIFTSDIRQRAKLQKSIIFQFIVIDRVDFGAIFSTCVVYTKTIIIYLGVGESGGN